MGTALPRSARIDLLRGIAVVLVMLLHFSLTYRLPVVSRLIASFRSRTN